MTDIFEGRKYRGYYTGEGDLNFMFEWQEQYLVIVPGCRGRIENTRTLSRYAFIQIFFNTENVPRYEKKKWQKLPKQPN